MPSFLTKRIVIIVLVLAVVVIGVFGAISLFKEKTPVPTPPAEKVAGPKHEIIGRSVEGRNIEAFTYGDGEKHIVFVGGIHGGYEWNSVLLAYRFIDHLDQNPDFLHADLTVTVIPSANPDGVFDVIGKEGRFTLSDGLAAGVRSSSEPGFGRFNANDVDLNRNFDCKWKPESTWRSKAVSAGSRPFSEPEAVAIRDFVLENSPDAVIFWHSQANAVFASECQGGILPKTLDILDAYTKASGYTAVKTFDAYEVTGDAEGWLASIGIPALTVELKTHETIEWEQNLAGVKAVLDYYSQE